MTAKLILNKFTEHINHQIHSIRTKLFITYFIIILILVMGIGAASYNFSSRSVEEKLQEANTELINQINLNLESNFFHIRNIMLIPYNNSEYITGANVYSNMSEIDRISFQRKMSDYFLRSLYITARSDLENFFIFSNDGRMLFTSSGETEDYSRNNFGSQEWVKSTIDKNGSIYFSSAYTKTVRGLKKILFSTSIKIKDISNTNNFSIVKAEFNFDMISETFSSDAIGKDSETILIDNKGQVIYSTNGRSPVTALDSAIVSQMPGNKGTFWAETGGRQYMISYAKSAISGWNIISMIPREQIFEASDKIRSMTVIVSVIALVLSALISLVMSSMITKPLLKLDYMVDSVRKGDLSVRIEGNSKDEIGRIYSVFNMLIEEVNSLIETKYIYQIKEREYELNLLHAQINPHFLYNTLDTIRAMADMQHADDVVHMINLLADMLRYSIKSINEPVTVKQELDHAAAYLTICSIRFGEKIDFAIDVEDSVMEYKIPRLILQPVIENCIRHGHSHDRRKEFILVTGGREKHSLVFTVKDNGSGMHEDILKRVKKNLYTDEAASFTGKSGSIGLSNINSRLRLLYGEGQYITVSSLLNAGTEVRLHVPLTDTSAN